MQIECLDVVYQPKLIPRYLLLKCGGSDTLETTVRHQRLLLEETYLLVFTDLSSIQKPSSHKVSASIIEQLVIFRVSLSIQYT